MVDALINKILRPIFLAPIQLLAVFHYKYFVIFVLLFWGALTSVENLSLFIRGDEIFILPEISLQNFIWISLLAVLLVRMLLFLGLDFRKIEAWSFFYLIFVLYMILALVWSNYYANAVRDILFSSFPLVMYFLTYSWVKNDIDAVNVIRHYFWYGFIFVVFLTIYSLSIGRPLFGIDYGGVERFWGPMGWSALGYFLMPYCIDRFVAALVKGGIVNYILFSMVLVLFLITLGRLALMSLMIAMFFIFLFWSGNAARKLKLGLMGGAICLLSLSFILPPIIQRTFGDSGEFQWSGRNNSAQYVADRLDSGYFGTIFGNGSGSARSVSEELRGTSSEVRSKYFIVYKDYGVVGLTFYLIAIISLLLSSIKYLYIYSRDTSSENEGYERNVAFLSQRLACAIFIAILGIFDNLTFVYITTVFFIFFSGSALIKSK